MPIHGYLGGVISATAPSVTTAGASGVFTLEEQLQAAGQNNWPGYQISRSVRLRASASAYFNRTPASASNRTTWTWSAWVKRGKLGAAQVLFSAGTGTAEFRLGFISSDAIEIYEYTSPSYNWQKITTAVYRDPSAWYHIELTYDTTNGTAANRIKLYVNGTQVTSFSTDTNPTSSFSGYVNSAVAHGIGSFSTGANYLDGYLTEVNFIDGQALTPASFGAFDALTGVWNPIRYSGTYGTNGFYLNFSNNSSLTGTDQVPTMTSATTPSGVASASTESDAAHAAWKAFDKSASTYWFATATSGWLKYQFASAPVITYYAISADGAGYGPSAWTFEGSNDNSTWTVLDTRSGYGSTIGLTPITFSCSNTNAYTYYRLNCSAGGGSGNIAIRELAMYPNVGLGTDYSGNGNYWTPSAGISLTTGTTYDSMVDVPIGYGGDTGVGGEVRGNYAVLNGVDKNASTTLTEANLSNYASGAAWQGARASIAINSGKWYIEGNITNHGTGYAIGFANSSWDLGQTAGNTNASGIYWDGSGTSYYWFTPTVTSAGFTPVNGNSFVMAIDMDAGKVWFGYITSSTTWLGGGNPATGSTPTFTFTPNITLYPCLSTYNTTQRISINFGQRPFSTTAPSGFKALCTQNLPAPSIVNGANYMAASLYTGTGGSQTISNAVNSISFQPDLVWVKSRSAATDHKLTDVVRGVTKALISNTTGAETTDTNGLTAFGASGFTVGTDTVYNNSGATYVGWQWKGGGTGVSNTQGTITSTVSANTTAGFSVVAYTGNGVTSATVGHGLNVTPSFIITKNRDIGTAAYNWYSNHISLGAGQMEIDLTLNSINPATTFSNGGLAPASSWTDQVFSFVSGSSSANNVNNNTSKFIAYCFAPIAGYSAFGSYSGNNTTDGPFVYLGFRPRFLIIKSTSNGTDWVIIDTARNPYNLSSTALVSNSSNNEATIGTVNQIDILSNGFKPRNNTGYVNASQTYIYAAFAENPFNISRAR